MTKMHLHRKVAPLTVLHNNMTIKCFLFLVVFTGELDSIANSLPDVVQGNGGLVIGSVKLISRGRVPYGQHQKLLSLVWSDFIKHAQRIHFLLSANRICQT